MTPERWRKVEELFEAAAARPSHEQAPFLQEACAGDNSLRGEVEALLRADQEEKGLLEDIASRMAAGWVAETDGKSHHDLVGRTLGRYKILAPLGHGGMGEVYLAQDMTLDRKAAIKLLPRQFTRDLDRLRRFEQEARAASALNHPNIITIYEIGDWDGGRFIATEYVEGVTLRERLAKSPLTLAEVLDIGLQAGSALAAAHQAGILHRDIKPANLMLRTDGYLKVLDFGLAKLIGPRAAGDVTETGRVMGTINYMSPEQAMGQPLDPRTDVFSLGVVLYEIATGHRLFAGKTEGATYDRILHQEVPPMQQFAPGLPRELDQVIRRAVEKDRANRYQTAGDFRADLKRLAEGTSTEAASRERAKTRSHRWWIAAAAVVVLALIGALLFFSRSYLAHNKAVGPDGIPGKSIAVLPFENLSEDKTNTYFADGIQDEILTRLSKIADLRVISRTSTDHYKSAPNNLSEIGRQLGVANILEGSVQKSGNAVRVNVQLIKVADDSHLWAETFDRNLTDIFSVESNIAKAIAEKLQAKITGREERVIADKPTSNAEAYDVYLRGLSITLKPAITPASYVLAQKYLREAVRLDPQFAHAWALLSFVESRGYRTRALQATPALQKEARKAADIALALQPTMGEAVLAKGYYFYSCLGDYENATLYLEQAYRLLPNSSRVPESLAYVARRQGQWDRSDSYFRQAVQLDPRNVSILTQWVNTDLMRRRFGSAAEKVEQILRIVPDDLDSLVLKGAIAQAQGDLPAAAAILDPLKPAMGDINAIETKAYQAVLERKTQAIIPRLQEVASHPEPTLGFYNGEMRFWLGWAQEIAGDHGAAEQTWRESRTFLEGFFKEQPGNERLLNDLVLVNIMLKDRAAFSLIEQVKKLDPTEKDALDGPEAVELLARAAAVIGEPGRAFATLPEVLATPYEGLWGANVPLTPALVRLDPMFDSLRNLPGYQKLLADSEPAKSGPKSK